MNNRTTFKEKRNTLLWYVFFTVWMISCIATIIVYKGDKEKLKIVLLGIPFLFVIYRTLVYLFNSFLLIFFRRKIKLNRLKNNITPIYKIKEGIESFSISKYLVQYTSLDLEWVIPFSVLFEEQEYIKEDYYKFYFKDSFSMDDTLDISELYEERHLKETVKNSLTKSVEELKQEKINNLNKIFNENYK